MASDATGPRASHEHPSPWHASTSGTTNLAAALMIFGGVMAIFEGISAVAKDNLFVVTRHYVFEFSLAGWGWVHLILGVVLLVAGGAVIRGALWARFLGVTVAGLGAVANFLWLPYYPLWALVLIAVNILVIWALCAGMQREADAGRTT
ncbi:hypothetical protein WEB32_26960 [Streptomyces netropsis]|uniref:Vacuolar-type H+-ATPase subunit I/STV1 n=1 Tax=Streptomyces netropsis TaxID=55404 RepID=A0A7W7LEC0_STRNE|nr:hypothetical protein [Streptomyces netropsis]MBB4888479.1 vacuolar-type H+-ATPase subunit I/STV1 [Streptomyces netropsis]GGR28982.1 hypothetical protein GCM10010219_37150 [Streptomyces netropsis]